MYTVNPAKQAAIRDGSKPKQPERYEVGVSLSGSVLIMIPETYEEAVTSNESTIGLSARQEEISSMESLNMYTLTELPEGQRSLCNRWIYSL